MKDFYLLEKKICDILMKKRLCGRPRVKLCGWLEMKRNNEIITKKIIFASGILEKELCLE